MVDEQLVDLLVEDDEIMDEVIGRYLDMVCSS